MNETTDRQDDVDLTLSDLTRGARLRGAFAPATAPSTAASGSSEVASRPVPPAAAKPSGHPADPSDA